MILVDPGRVCDLIRTVVDTEILPRFRRLERADIRQKATPGDLVTEADLRAEQALTRMLTRLLPGSVVVGEEACYADEAVFNLLEHSEPVWVIDPLDGTGNFVRGQRKFACIVALVHRGETVMGWIDACLERHTTYAVLGAGVHTSTGEKAAFPAIPTRVPVTLSALSGQVGGKSARDNLEQRARRIGWVGSAGRTYLELLNGHIDFAAFTRLNVWDHAAGVLIVREAGGAARLADGKAYSPLMRRYAAPLTLAPDEQTWALVANALMPPDGCGP